MANSFGNYLRLRCAAVEPLHREETLVQIGVTQMEGLIGLIIVIIVVGIVALLVRMLIDMIPMDERFKQIANVLVMLVAVLIILSKALPLIGVQI